MTLPSRIRAPLPSLALMAFPYAAGNDDSGSRTLVGTAIVLVAIAVVVAIGMMMTKSKAA
jgi:hypothetical protein